MDNQHRYSISLGEPDANGRQEIHECSCGDFSRAFKITTLSVDQASTRRAEIAGGFAEHVEFAYREAHCEEHPLVHIAQGTDTLSDERFHDECAMRAAVYYAEADDDGSNAQVARWSFDLADAMLAERKRRRESKKTATETWAEFEKAAVLINFPSAWPSDDPRVPALKIFAATLFPQFILVPNESVEVPLLSRRNAPVDLEIERQFIVGAMEIARGRT